MSASHLKSQNPRMQSGPHIVVRSPSSLPPLFALIMHTWWCSPQITNDVASNVHSRGQSAGRHIDK